MLESLIEFNGLVMNDQSKETLAASPYYWIRITSVDGIFGDEVRYESHPIPGSTGERSGDVFRNGKSITLTGEIWARGLAELRAGQRAVQQAFWDLQKHQLKFTLYGEVQVYITCRVQQPLIMTEEQPDGKIMRRFTVGLRADDPRSYRVSDNSLYPSFQT